MFSSHGRDGHEKPNALNSTLSCNSLIKSSTLSTVALNTLFPLRAVQHDAEVLRTFVTVAELVLRNHGSSLKELGEAPRHVEYAVLARQQDNKRETWHEDHRQAASVLLPLMGAVELPTHDMHDA